MKWKLMAGVTLVFIFGALVGTLGTGVYLKHRHPSFKRDMAVRKTFIIKRLTRKLDLTDVQKRRIEKIVDQMHTMAEKRFQEHRKQMRNAFEQGFSEMKKELTPAQQNKLDEMRKKIEQRREKKGRRPHPGSYH